MCLLEMREQERLENKLDARRGKQERDGVAQERKRGERRRGEKQEGRHEETRHMCGKSVIKRGLQRDAKVEMVIKAET